MEQIISKGKRKSDNKTEKNSKNKIVWIISVERVVVHAKDNLTRDWQEEPHNRYVVFNTPEEIKDFTQESIVND